ncbi:MAG: class I SAM-dependent methyltransferase [Anaerolinea sp.]|nr:class I SAM-dependent methyltransferase [Anaerolinea sp.]
MTVPSCPVCVHPESVFVTVSLLGGEMRRCVQCGLIFRVPLWTVESSRQIGAVSAQDGDRRPTMQRVAGLLEQFKPAGGDLLDVGCAGGMLFAAVRDLPTRWHLHGVEPDQTWQDHLYPDARVMIAPIPPCPFEGGTFEAATVLDAIYLLPDPAAVFAELRRVLKPGGILILDLPPQSYLRLRGFWGRLLGLSRTQTFNAYPFYFSRDSLNRLLIQNGFKLRALLPDSGIVHPTRFLRWFLRAYLGMIRPLNKLIQPTVWLAPKVILVGEAQ